MKKTKNEIQNRFLSRRQFLMSTGSAFLTLPPLISLMPRTLAAQVSSQKKIRSVIYTGLFGIDSYQISPTNLSMTTYPGAVYTRYIPLSSTAAPFSRLIDSSFTSMYPYMNVIKGLSLTSGYYFNGNHTVSMLGGMQTPSPTFGRSIDLVLENSTNVYKQGEVIKQKALRIGDIPGYNFSFDCTNGNLVNPSFLRGDMQVFNQIFLGLTGTPVTVPVQQQTNSKLIVDQIYADLKSLENNPRLSSDDKQTLSRYIASVYDLQLKVQANNAGAGPICSQPTIAIESTSSGGNFGFPNDSSWGIQNNSLMYDNYIEMIRLAFVCDLTRVVLIKNALWSDQPVKISVDGDLHHAAPSSNAACDNQQWGLKKMLRLAQRLQSTQDPFSSGENLLDNSSILYTNHVGSWTTSHNIFSMPAILFGKGGGLFKTGYYVDYSQLNKTDWQNTGYTPGRPYKQLLQSIMQSMGVTKTEYSQYGDGNGYGEFKEAIDVNKNDPTAYTAYRNEHNDLLPFIAS